MPDTGQITPTTKLRELPSWHLRIVCGRCGRQSVKATVELGRPDTSLWQVLLKLRCSGLHRGRVCKGSPGKATLLAGMDTALSPRGIREIKVL